MTQKLVPVGGTAEVELYDPVGEQLDVHEPVYHHQALFDLDKVNFNITQEASNIADYIYSDEHKQRQEKDYTNGYKPYGPEFGMDSRRDTWTFGIKLKLPINKGKFRFSYPMTYSIVPEGEPGEGSKQPATTRNLRLKLENKTAEDKELFRMYTNFGLINDEGDIHSAYVDTFSFDIDVSDESATITSVTSDFPYSRDLDYGKNQSDFIDLIIFERFTGDPKIDNYQWGGEKPPFEFSFAKVVEVDEDTSIVTPPPQQSQEQSQVKSEGRLVENFCSGVHTGYLLVK